RIYGRGGLVQHQSFLPAAAAERAFGEILRLCQRRGLPPYLSVLKRHRPDKFLLSHAVDGYSLALDFRVPADPARLVSLSNEMDAIVLANSGRFYFAKDGMLSAEHAQKFLGKATLAKLRELK